jgi:hypothetical protein
VPLANDTFGLESSSEHVDVEHSEDACDDEDGSEIESEGQSGVASASDEELSEGAEQVEDY